MKADFWTLEPTLASVRYPTIEEAVLGINKHGYARATKIYGWTFPQPAGTKIVLFSRGKAADSYDVIDVIPKWGSITWFKNLLRR